MAAPCARWLITDNDGEAMAPCPHAQGCVLLTLCDCDGQPLVETVCESFGEATRIAARFGVAS